MAIEPGKIEEVWDEPVLHAAIGKFIVQFSQLEFTIRHLLGSLLDLSDPQFNIVISSYDFATLCRVSLLRNRSTARTSTGWKRSATSNTAADRGTRIAPLRAFRRILYKRRGLQSVMHDVP
jgi:hypothetical protein